MTKLVSRPPTRLGRVRRAGLLLLLALALGRPGGSPAAPAQAAPPAQETNTTMRFYLNVDQPAQYCAGQVYSLAATPLVELSGRLADGRRFNAPDRIVTGVPIKVATQDQSIATIAPARQQSGALGLNRSISLDQQPALGRVTFQLTAKKAGTTNLYLIAEVPARWAGGRALYFGPNQMPAGFPIKVIDCEYLVTATYTWELAGTGFRYWTVGSLRATIKASDPEFYGGDGLFDFFLNHYDLICSERLSYLYPNHITARRLFTTDELELSFSMTANAVNPACANSYLLANSPFTDPAGPWNGTPIKFPAAGGTRRLQLVANAPGQPPSGWVTITVTPLTPSGGR